jgi:pimeloyl-ACP methyl ester carboxylesterase
MMGITLLPGFTMPDTAHLHPSDIHGLSRLAVDGVLGTTALVEQLHRTISGVAPPLGQAVNEPTRGITGLVYRSIRGITHVTGGTVQFAFNQVVPRLRQRESTPQRERLLAVINGVLGDHLDESGNPLAIPMSLRQGGKKLDLADPGQAIGKPRRKLLIALHGLCMNDLQWTPDQQQAGFDLPGKLADQLGYSALHLHYNSGRHISSNGQHLAWSLEDLLQNWPEPVEELVLLGHSMGGLLARSACHYADLWGHQWPHKACKVITLGSPHHGAPLERIGNKIDHLLGSSPYSAPFTRLGRIRSAGITDLRHGYLLDEDWHGQDCFTTTGDRRCPVRHPEHIDYYAIAATTDQRSDSLRSRLIGDGLVPVDSALGRHADARFRLPVQQDRQQVMHETGHLGLIHHPEVHKTIGRWLQNR